MSQSLVGESGQRRPRRDDPGRGPAGQNRGAIAALGDIRAEFAMTTLSDPTRLALTEAAFASADRLWREEMRRTYG